MKIQKTNYLKKYGFEKMALKAVLFDMDGVLFNSMTYHTQAWSEAVEKFGLHISLEEAYEHEGRTGRDTINILTRRIWGRDATEDEVREIYAEKSRRFNAFPEALPMQGAFELLQKIKRDGFQIILVTGSGQVSLLNRLQRHFPDVFHKDTMVTSFDIKFGKPRPEPYLMGLQKAGVQPWEALVVENAPLGVEAGVAARIFTIAVNTGPLPDSKLLEKGANLLLPSVQSLCDNWESIRDQV